MGDNYAGEVTFTGAIFCAYGQAKGKVCPLLVSILDKTKTTQNFLVVTVGDYITKKRNAGR